jgi:hypothetical protein
MAVGLTTSPPASSVDVSFTKGIVMNLMFLLSLLLYMSGLSPCNITFFSYLSLFYARRQPRLALQQAAAVAVAVACWLVVLQTIANLTTTGAAL